MNAKSKCYGYKGHWECSEEYPDHMVPVENFSPNRARGKDQIQYACKACFRYRSAAVRHPITGERIQNWKDRIAKSMGGRPKTPEWKSYLAKAGEQWEHECGSLKYPWAYGQQRFLTGITHRKLPKVDRPKGRRVTVFKPDGKKGYVYVFRDHMKPANYYKVGASNDPQERLNEANTWGDFECLYPHMSDEEDIVSDCLSLEKEVHEALSKYRVKGEWFQCDKTFIINKILELVDAREKQAVAEQKVS